MNGSVISATTFVLQKKLFKFVPMTGKRGQQNFFNVPNILNMLDPLRKCGSTPCGSLTFFADTHIDSAISNSGCVENKQMGEQFWLFQTCHNMPRCHSSTSLAGLSHFLPRCNRPSLDKRGVARRPTWTEEFRIPGIFCVQISWPPFFSWCCFFFFLAHLPQKMQNISGTGIVLSHA